MHVLSLQHKGERMKFISIFSLVLGLALAAQAENASSDKKQQREQFKAMREQVAGACQQELATTGCEKGKGMMKCVKKYYKENRESGAKISDSCKSAVKQLRAMRKERKSNSSAPQAGGESS